MSLVQKSGNDLSTQTHPRTFECVSGPSVKERPNPKDRMEPEPDHSGQGLPSPGQTTCGSLCPREECKVGNIHVSDPGANVLETSHSLVQSWKNLYIEGPVIAYLFSSF